MAKTWLICWILGMCLVDCLQENILEKLHDHCFISIISNLPFDSHWACLKLCARSNVYTWLSTYSIILFFRLASNVFSIALHTKLGLSHPLVLWVSHYICNQPLDLMGFHLLCYIHGGERTTSHDVVWNAFVVIVKDARFHVSKKQTHVLSPVPM
jgi:hypothetical protein